MADAIIGGLLSGAGGLFGSLINADMADYINQQQIGLASRQLQLEQQFIREQNEYNSPAMQLQRYKDAGLNPNLIYGEGKASAGNQTDIARYKAPQLNVPQPGDALTSIGDAISIALQAGMTRAQIQKMENESYAAKMLGTKYEQDAYSSWLRNMFESVVSGVNPGVIHTEQDLNGIGASPKFRKYKAEVSHTEFVNDLVQSQKELNSANIRISHMKADAQYYYNQNIQPLIQEIMIKKSAGIDIQNDLLNLQKKFYKADKYFHYGKEVLNAIFQGINAFKFPLSPGGSPTPNGNWYGSPFYPSESYVPGL